MLNTRRKYGSKPLAAAKGPAKYAGAKAPSQTYEKDRHPLAYRLSETLVKYRDHLIAKHTSEVTSTYHSLVKDLAAASTQKQHFADQYSTARRALLAPLGNALLQFNVAGSGSRSGRPRAVRARLDARMRYLKRDAAAKAVSLETLWREWDAARGEVDDAAKALRQALGAEEAALQAKREAGKMLREEVGTVCEEAIALCKAAEKEYKIDTGRKRQDILEMLQSQL